ncbi:MAG TPA: SIS domain-containing protein [Ramlibacter sp.]|uniref:SIS domain-containing protein n=1 Tax=Ramlibacter sp. TaxID=1917967 RepID=UPI002C20F47F|nr:SIS domain-containing protein [Ramlibacter sp.]HVZ43573.1 SIS domain-containing protein [Ramlibacter sp.]
MPTPAASATPAAPATARKQLLASLYAVRDALDALIYNKEALASIEHGAQLLAQTFARGGRVHACGSGAAILAAMHFADELARRQGGAMHGLPVQAVSDIVQTGSLADTLGYDRIYSRYVLSQCLPGDCLVAFSATGKNASVLNAAVSAKERGMTVLAVTSAPSSELQLLADVGIGAGTGEATAPSHELHAAVIRVLVELTEREVFPGNFELPDDGTQLIS